MDTGAGVSISPAVQMVVSAVLAFLVVGALAGAFSSDDTDPPGWAKSGMSLHIDHRTGCHYLGKGGKSLTPRLDRRGNHICEHPDGP